VISLYRFKGVEVCGTSIFGSEEGKRNSSQRENLKAQKNQLAGWLFCEG
jgi:hypothetical protein